jgi:hypothetical protein
LAARATASTDSTRTEKHEMAVAHPHDLSQPAEQ